MLKWAFNPALRPVVQLATVVEINNNSTEDVPQKENKSMKGKLTRSNTGTLPGRIRVSSFLGSLTGINEGKRWKINFNIYYIIP